MELDFKLREARRLRDLSQKDAARLSRVGEKTISSFETGARIDTMKVSQLLRLLRVYAIAPADFFGDAFELEISGPPTNPHNHPHHYAQERGGLLL
jgi:transcriptional regulator with XRE-family HTH domain